MQFKESKVILFHGVVDLRKGASGLLALVDSPELGIWYLFSNRTRSLMKCVRLDRSGLWMGSRRLKQGRYLMKALQDHCRHHQEAIYLKLKHASYTIDQIAANIEHTGQNQHAQTMAAAHQLFCQKPRSHKTNKDQMTLGL